MHRLVWSAALIAVATLTVGSGPLDAQSYRNAIGVFGGGTWTTGLAPDAAADPQLPMGWNGGLEFERWLGDGRFGLRLGASFTEADITPWTTDLNLYSARAGLMMRLLAPREGRALAPFLSLGGGSVLYNFSDVQHFDNSPSDPDVRLRTDPTTRPAVTAGFGFDVAPGTGVGLRFEGVDRMTFQSPFVDGDGAAYGMVHHLRYTASLQVRFGELPRTRVLAVATPTAEAPPEPEPEPERRAAPEEPATPVEPADTAHLEVREPPAEPEPMDTAVDPRRLPTSLAAATPPADTATAKPDRPVPTADAATAGYNTAFTVQIAAYENANSARRLAERMRRGNLPAWVTQVQRSGRIYHRVRVGAVPSESEAQQLGRRLRTEFSTPVWVVPFDRPSDVSEEVVRATRTFIRGS